uniref:Uncharacterized protein n=1 Tax=Cacopsylla melanoneura TaxID=428564 RepID=A0A8D8SDY7_9HEMI
MTLDGNTVLVNNELGEVPLDGINQSSSLLVLQKFEQRSSIVPVDLDLFEKIKIDVPLFGELTDLICITWLLSSELITRESQDSKSAVSQLVVQFNQLLVMLASVSTFGCNIYNDQNLAFVVGQGDVFTFDVFDSEIVNRLGVLPGLVSHALIA